MVVVMEGEVVSTPNEPPPLFPSKELHEPLAPIHEDAPRPVKLLVVLLGIGPVVPYQTSFK